MRVLITGINGFIGSHLAERLLAEGILVRGIARQPESAGWLAHRGAEITPGDLRQPASALAALAGCDAVLHTAAWTGSSRISQRDAWTINVAATGDLLSAAESASVQRFVYFSSVAVYGVNPSPVIDETAGTPTVGQLYPDSKIAAEALVRAAQQRGVPTTIVRPASTYGPRGMAWTVNPIEQIKADRIVLLGQDDGLVNTGFIDNLVDGVLLALASPAAIGQTFNLCDGTTVSYRQFYLRYAAMLGRDRLPTRPAWLARGATSAPGRLLRRLLGRPPVGRWSLHFRFNPSRFSIAKAQRLLGYQPKVDFEQGMQRTEAWLRTAGFLPPERPPTN